MGSFDDPEIPEMVQFLDQEIVNIYQKVSGSRNCRKGRQILYEKVW